MSLFDCFNRSDAMISDVSGIASDSSTPRSRSP